MFGKNFTHYWKKISPINCGIFFLNYSLRNGKKILIITEKCITCICIIFDSLENKYYLRFKFMEKEFHYMKINTFFSSLKKELILSPVENGASRAVGLT